MTNDLDIMIHFISIADLFDNLLGHERRMDSFSVKFCRHFCGLFNISTVHQPEPGRHCGGKVYTVIYKRQWCGSRNVLPLSSGCTS